MSFLIDPALLYAGARAYRRIAEPAAGDRSTTSAPAPSRAQDAAVGAAFMAVFWGVSIGLYRNQRWTKPVWKLCRAQSGRDWMLNSGVLRLDHANASRRTHVVSALIFATYPLWLWLGMRGGQPRRGS